MAIPLLGLIPKIVKTAAGILGVDSVKDVVDALQNNKLTPEQRVALETATLDYQKEMRAFDLEELKTAVSESVAMISSPDKYVSRARPTMLYVGSGVAAFIAFVMGVVIFKHTPVEWGAVGALTSLLTALFGAGGYYIGQRTKEKMNGGGGE